jgi:hypothetical protein
VELFVTDWDCILGDVFGMNNFYLYRFENKTLSQFIAWDKDNAFSWARRGILVNADANVLSRRALAIPEYRRSYMESMLKLAAMSGAQGGWLDQEVDRMFAQINDAALADPNKLYLLDGALQIASNDLYTKSIADLHDFAAQRTAYVLDAVQKAGYEYAADAPQINSTDPIIPGTTFTIYGSNLAAPNGKSVVYLNGFAAEIVSASPTQIVAKAPANLAGSTFPLVVFRDDVPGIFTLATLASAP